jgi:hypothetical protein
MQAVDQSQFRRILGLAPCLGSVAFLISRPHGAVLH